MFFSKRWQSALAIFRLQCNNRHKSTTHKLRESVRRRGLERYVKILLYTYPLLKTVEKDYEECIRNKALLSYGNGKTAEETATEIATEILCQRRFFWLKEKLQAVLNRLSEEERALVEVRYFGKKKSRLDCVCVEKKTGKPWSERKYFRKHERLCEKLDAMIKGMGITKEIYESDFAPTELFDTVERFVERKERQYSSVS